MAEYRGKRRGDRAPGYGPLSPSARAKLAPTQKPMLSPRRIASIGALLRHVRADAPADCTPALEYLRSLHAYCTSDYYVRIRAEQTAKVKAAKLRRKSL